MPSETISGPQLDYLAGGIFHYPATLASAGQVMTETGGLSSARTMITDRDRETSFVVADSGGFQIQQGTLGPWRYAHTVLQSLRWQEDHGDYVMALDFPTGGINSGAMDVHIDRLINKDGEDLHARSRANGLDVAFNACLRQTFINTEIMLRHRRRDRGFLVVLQGTNEAESSEWYRVHRPLIRDAEGVSFAGTSNTSYRLMLHRLIDMRDDGTLARIKHIHVLGTATFDSACLLTTIQRCIRSSINPHIQITFDTATPFQEANERYRVFTHYIADNVGCSVKYTQPSGAPVGEQDHEQYLYKTVNAWCHLSAQDERTRVIEDNSGRRHRPMRGREAPFAAISLAGQMLRVNDLSEVRLDPHGDGLKKFIFKPTSETSLLMCLHNVDAATRSYEEILDRWLHPHPEISGNFPIEFLAIKSLIEMVFNPNLALARWDELNELMDQGTSKFDRPTAEVPAPRPTTWPTQSHAFIEEYQRYFDMLVKPKA